jgi:nitroreductase
MGLLRIHGAQIDESFLAKGFSDRAFNRLSSLSDILWDEEQKRHVPSDQLEKAVYDLMMKRRSVRHFDNKAIPDSVIDELVDVANNAPSGGNIQPISIIIVREADGRKELAAIVGNQPWVKNAPISMVFCIDLYRVKKWASMFNAEFKGENVFALFLIAYADLMVAAQNVAILAQSRGLGSVYVGSIVQSIDRAREYFEMPECVLPMMVLSVGYPKSIPKHIPKLQRSVMTHWEKYRLMSDEEVRKAYEEKYGDYNDGIQYLEKAFVETVEADKQQGDKWTEWAKDEMKRLEIRNNAQFLFRLRYPTDKMMEENKELFLALRKAGFVFF